MRFSCQLSVLLLLGIVFSAGGTELLRFHAGEVKLAGGNRPGADKFSITAEKLPDTGSEGVALRWNPGCSPYIETWISAPPEQFEPFPAAEFTLNAWLPPDHSIDSITLRFRDAKGEVFQFRTPVRQDATGRREIRYRIDSGKQYTNSYGNGRDGKIDWPLQFIGLVCGGLDKVRQPGGIILDSLDYRIDGPALSVGFAPEHPLNLILPDEKTPPSLRLRNRGSQPGRLTGTVSVRDADGKASAAEVSADVPADTDKPFPLPGDFARLGIWYATWSLKDNAGNRYEGERQFAKVIPAPEPGDGGFRLGASGISGPSGEIAWKIAGVRSLRSNPDWFRMQPEAGVWDFRTHDEFFSRPARRGVAIHFLLGPPPEWAVAKDYKPLNPALKDGWKRPDREAYRTFLSRLAERYKGKVAVYIVGNEPDLVHFCNYSDDEYLELLKITYRTIKAIDPDARVANGGISSLYSAAPRSSNYLRHHPKLLSRLLTEGKNYYDVFAFHGHGSASIYRDQLRELRKMGAIGAGKPWISSETGISSIENRIGESGQARELFKKVILMRAFGADSCDWFEFWSRGTDPNDKEHNYGILKRDYQPKAAFPVYNVMARYFQTPEFVRSFEDNDNVSGFLFRDKTGGSLIPYWSFNQLDPEQPVLFTGMGDAVTAVDLFGNESPCPVRDGAVLRKTSEDPEFLRTAAGSAPQYGGRILESEAFSVTPGENSAFRFRLRNPLERKLDCRLSFGFPAGLSGESEKTVSLRPGEKAEMTLNVKATETFRSYSLVPERLTVAIAANDLPALEIHRAVISNIPIRSGAFPSRPTFRLDDSSQVTNYAISGPENHLFWKGPQDLAADIFLARDRKTLRMKAVVTDDIHRQPDRGGDVWNGDGIQFAVKLPNQNRTWEFGLTRLADEKSEVWCWTAPNGFDPARTAQKIALRTSRDDRSGTTVYEAEIPFDAISLTPEDGKSGFRFNLLVNDNDGEKRESGIRIVPGIESDKNWSRYPLVNFR